MFTIIQELRWLLLDQLTQESRQELIKLTRRDALVLLKLFDHLEEHEMVLKNIHDFVMTTKSEPVKLNRL